MVIFHSYVKLPEGISFYELYEALVSTMFPHRAPSAVSRWTRNLWVEARCWEQGAMWSWPSLCALQMERHGTYGTCGDCCGSTCASTCASSVPKRIWRNWNSDSGGWSIFFSFLFSLPSVVICTVCNFPPQNPNFESVWSQGHGEWYSWSCGTEHQWWLRCRHYPSPWWYKGESTSWLLCNIAR